MPDRRITFFHLPLEIEKNPRLTATDKDIAWTIFSVKGTHGHNHSCFYSNKELAIMNDRDPLTVSRSIKKLIKEFVVISTVTVDRVMGTRRSLSINPEYKEYGRKFVEDYNKRVEEQTGGGLIKISRGIDKNINPPPKKSNDFKGVEVPIYNKDINKDDDFLSGNHFETKGFELVNYPQPNQSTSCSSKKEPPAMGRRENIDLVIQHWNSKGSPLTKHRIGGTKQFRKIVSVVGKVLTQFTEKTVTDTIDLYHHSLTNPALSMYRYRNVPPTKVSLDEFFEFSVESKNMISVHRIEALRGATSWFDLLRRVGAEGVADRFAIVPEDKYPIITKELKRIVSAWDGHPTITGNAAERQLRKASVKLVDFYQRIRGRIQTHQGILRVSAPAFFHEYLWDYILNSLNLDRFRLYWLISQQFMDNFENHLVANRVIARPPMVRHLKRRTGRDDQSGAFGSRGRAVNYYRDDCEHELSAADFQDL